MDKKLGTATAEVFARIKDANRKYNLIENGDHIVTGLSGGPDSVCLFFALYMMREELGITLSAVHVNHKMRPGDAEADQKYVETLCEKFGVPCRSVVCDCIALATELGITGEEAGRKARYEAFDAEAERILGADAASEENSKAKQKIKIALAHNAEDQAETLLFRLVRGTGTDGLAGIERKRKSENGYTVIRPIIDVHRADIEAFCRENKLEARIDKTNLEAIYTRNKIRLGLVPYISENFNENITETLNRLANIASEDKEYMWQQADAAYRDARVTECAEDGVWDKEGAEVVFALSKLQQMHPAIRHRVVLKALSELGLVQDVSTAHLENADDVIMRGITGKTAEFPAGYRMVIRYEQAAFKRIAPNAAKCRAAGVIADAEDSEAKLSVPKFSVPKFSVPKLTAKVVSYEEWQVYKALRADMPGVSDAPGMPKNFAAFDYGALSEARTGAEPILRMREAGDFIAIRSGKTSGQDAGAANIKGAGTEDSVQIKHKKLQDLFVDNKIPRDLREDVLVVAAGNEILWIIGADSGLKGQPFAKGRFTANYSVKDTSKDVLILEIGI